MAARETLYRKVGERFDWMVSGVCVRCRCRCGLPAAATLHPWRCIVVVDRVLNGRRKRK